MVAIASSFVKGEDSLGWERDLEERMNRARKTGAVMRPDKKTGPNSAEFFAFRGCWKEVCQPETGSLSHSEG